MKKVLLTTLIVLSVIFGFAGHVDKATALKVANTFRDNNKAYQASLQRGRAVTPLADLTGKTAFGNFYIFSDEHSFVVVSAEDCVQPILAYSMENPFKTENMPESVMGWMQGYDEQIGIAKTRSASATSEVKQAWELLKSGKPLPATRSVVVGPLISTKWDQTVPYNGLCPVVPSGGSGGRAYTGCVATAMAQIMKFWSYPEHGIGSHSYVHGTYGTQTADYGATTYDWTNMKNDYSSYTTDEANAVATLMYHCGVSVDMNYGHKASGAATADVANALKVYFNYSQTLYHANRASYGDDDWIALLKHDLDAGRPIQYHGSSESGGGHSFVCDGYDSDDNFSFNWGWSGWCDGYYVVNDLTPGTGGSGAGQGSYNVGQGAIFGIEPPTNLIWAPQNLVAVYDNGTAVLNWTASTGAASYKVYRNDMQIASVTTTTYTDNAVPYGTVRYYVRAADSEGYLSLSSNYADVTHAYGQPVVNDLSASIDSNNVILNWTAPAWCYPETESAVLDYGEGEMHYSFTVNYYAHRYMASDLSQYANKSVYKVETYVKCPGNYTVYVYNNTVGDKPDPNSLAATASVRYEGMLGWIEIALPQPVNISGASDLWVVMKQEVSADETYPVPSFNLDQYNANACYFGSSSPTALNSVSSNYKISWFIRAFITDGTYTYNIYRNTANRNAVKIAENLNTTTYTDSGLEYGHYEYHITTNYYNGESDASNVAVIDFDEPVSEYTVTTAVSPAEGGSVTGGGVYKMDTICTLTATPADNYYFTRFENSIVNGIITDNPYTFTVTDDCTVTAYFATVEVGNIEIPAAICSGNALSLTAPEVTGDVQSTGWQLADNADFNSPVAYTDQELDTTYNGWYLRYWVNNTNLGDLFSNAVQITVKSIPTSEFEATACNSYNWNDSIYTVSGDYIQTFPAVNGCDSVVTLHLTINESKDITLEPVIACDSYKWNDSIYTISGNYVQVFKTVDNCDSTVTLPLTINNSAMSEFEETACNTYTWNDSIYTESGDYVQVFKTVGECDSTVTLHLTVKYSPTSGFDATACDSYEWNDSTYTVSGDYIQTFPAANECDSIVTLHLTINNSEVVDFDVSACESYAWNDSVYTESGDYVQEFKTVDGCDSIVTTHLTINHSVETTDDVTACGEYEWNGTTYATSGTYMAELKTVAGCDSIVTMNLTINKAYNTSFSVTSETAYTWEGTQYNQSGDYVKTFTAANGCDSIVTLHFTRTGVTCYERVTPNAAGTYVMGYLNGSTFIMPSHNNGTNSPKTITVTTTSNGFFTDEDNNPVTITLTSAGSGQYYISSTDANGNTRRLQRPNSNSGAATWAAANSTTRTAWTINSTGITQTQTTAIIFTRTYYLYYNNNSFYVNSFLGTGTVTNNLTFYKEVDCPTSCEPQTFEFDITACDSHIWDGRTYTEGGDYEYTYTDGNNCDSTVTMHLTINNSVENEFSEVACDSYKWNDSTYIVSGDYIQVFKAVNECDSTVTLHLTINNSVENEFSDVACDSYQWNDSTYTVSGDYIQMFKTVNNCDSTVMLHLTINNSIETEFSDVACDSYQWNDSTYTVGGDHIQLFKTVNDCDSTVMLHLTINNSIETEFSDVACDSYQWNDSIYTVGGDHIQMFKTVNNCDSTVTLHLTINNSIETEFSEVACDSYQWNDSTYTVSDDYVQMFKTVNNCDSTVTLHLTINSSIETEFSEVACDSYQWNDSVYTVSGDHIQMFKTVNDCDSTVTLHLTINNSYTTVLEPLTVCDSYEWYGELIYESQTLTHLDTAVNGCNSITKLVLTVNKTTYGNDELSVCESEMPYTWQGVEFTEAGSQTITLTNAAGCDSVVTLNLSVKPTTYGNDELSVCESEMPYTWQGVEFTEAGSQTITLTNAAGCDSVVTLNLSVKPTTYGNDETTICESQLPYIWQGVEFTEAGSQTITIDNVAGCDSVLTLTLHVNDVLYGNDYLAVCADQMPYTWQGVVFTEAGSQNITLESANHCDSIVTLHLTVNHADDVTIEGITEIVAGEETTLTASEGASYEWSNGETTQSITVAPVANTTYSVVVTDENGCTSTAEITVNVTEGIAETEVAVKVYPNPVKHSVSIEADGITKVRVIDMLGQTLYETRENGNTIRIDMSGFAVGQYFIEVSTSKGLATQKVVKQ